MQVAANTTKLVPAFVTANIDAAAEALFDGRRARPVCAYTQEGEAVVCCVRKNGWTIVARCFSRKVAH